MKKYQLEINDLASIFFKNLFLILEQNKQIFEMNKSKSNEKEFLQSREKILNKNIKHESGKEYIEIKDPFEIEKYIDGIKKVEKMTEEFYLTNNAQFIYANALFENYINRITKLTLKNNKKIYDNYYNHLVEIASKLNDKNLIKILGKKLKLIDHFDSLSSIIQLCNKIFRIEVKNKLYEKFFFELTELRERRNTLVHRGDIIDDIYKKSILNHLKRHKNSQQFLENHIKKYAKRDKLSVSPNYLVNVIGTLFFYGHLFKYQTLSITNQDIKDNKLIITNSIHDLLVFSFENKKHNTYYSKLLVVGLLTIENYFKSSLNSNYKKMTDIDKINWILLEFYYSWILEQDIKLAPDKKETTFNTAEIKKLLQNSKNSINKILDTINNEIFKEIISNFLNSNFKKMLIAVSSYLNLENLSYNTTKTWFMFKFLENDEEFNRALKDSNYFNSNHKPLRIYLVNRNQK